MRDNAIATFLFWADDPLPMAEISVDLVTFLGGSSTNGDGRIDSNLFRLYFVMIYWLDVWHFGGQHVSTDLTILGQQFWECGLFLAAKSTFTEIFLLTFSSRKLNAHFSLAQNDNKDLYYLNLLK